MEGYTVRVLNRILVLKILIFLGELVLLAILPFFILEDPNSLEIQNPKNFLSLLDFSVIFFLFFLINAPRRARIFLCLNCFVTRFLNLFINIP